MPIQGLTISSVGILLETLLGNLYRNMICARFCGPSISFTRNVIRRGVSGLGGALFLGSNIVFQGAVACLTGIPWTAAVGCTREESAEQNQLKGGWRQIRSCFYCCSKRKGAKNERRKGIKGKEGIGSSGVFCLFLFCSRIILLSEICI